MLRTLFPRFTELKQAGQDVDPCATVNADAWKCRLFPSVSLIFAIVPIREWRRTSIKPGRFRPSKDGLGQELQRVFKLPPRIDLENPPLIDVTPAIAARTTSMIGTLAPELVEANPDLARVVDILDLYNSSYRQTVRDDFGYFERCSP
jgi:hypothetical protein